MTNLIIHRDVTIRREYLLDQINKYLGRDFKSIAALHTVPDIHILELTESASIGIDDVKKLQKKMIFQPFEELYQVGIIFYADTLTAEAQNALLKTLEESGERSLYFLECANEKNLLDTIGSRAIKHFVKSSNRGIITEGHDRDGVPVSPQYVDQDLVTNFKYVEELVASDKEDNTAVKEFFNELNGFLHYRFVEMVNLGHDTTVIREFIRKVDEAHFRIKANVNKQLTLENIMLEMPKEMGGVYS